MGEAKRNQYSREQFLKKHTRCVYCGAPATTTDHCPPRCFFQGRNWPETFEFPACKPCNSDARLDEQALAVLIRNRLARAGQADIDEWNRLVQGTKNNQPEVVAEWLSVSANDKRRALRGAFGDRGDQMRSEGWGALNFGPLTAALVSRFMVRLGQSLYYLHNHEPLDGAIYALHVSSLDKGFTPELIQAMLEMAPGVAIPQRANQSLAEQFVYRFNHSAAHGVMYAVVEFNEQFIFQIIAVSRQMEEELREMAFASGSGWPDAARHDCTLKHSAESSTDDMIRRA